MRKPTMVALLAAALCASQVQAETLDQAAERIARARDGVRDASLTGRLKIKSGSGRVSISMDGTVETSYLRVGETRLVRSKMKTEQTMAMPKITLPPGVKLPPGFKLPTGGKTTTGSLTVVDGKFQWSETRNSQMPGVTVVKQHIPKPGAERAAAGSKAPAGTGVLMAGSLHDDFRETIRAAKRTATLKLLGGGSLLGRATTIIQSTAKPAELARMPAMQRAMLPAKAVVHFDNATGIPLSFTLFTSSGKKMSVFEATAIRVNTGLARSLFTYTPPPGARVQDLTKGGFPMPPVPRAPRR